MLPNSMAPTLQRGTGVKLGLLLAGRRPEDISQRLAQAREAGFSLCQLNFFQTGFTRSDLIEIADAMLEYGVRPVAVGCNVNPLRAYDATFMGTSRADLNLILHSLDIIGARRVVFWSGTHADTVFEEHPKNADEANLDILREFLEEIVDTTSARHYFLVIEPWYTHVLSSEERILDFHDSLDPDVAEHVRYVLDAPNLLSPARYPERNRHIDSICRAVGPLAGVIHLKDCIMPPDGEAGLPGPGQGALDYPAYMQALLQNAAPDAPAIVKNVPAAEYAAIRDYLLRLYDRWELA